MKTRWCSSAFALLLLFISVARAGIVITEEGGERTLISKGMIKNIPANADEQWNCFDIKKGLVLQVNPGSQTYCQGTAKEYCDAYSSMVQESMKKMTPEQKKMMDEVLQKSRVKTKGKVSVKNAGNGGTIAGFATVKHSVLVDGRLHEEVWIASSPVIKREIPDMETMTKLIRQFVACLSSGAIDLSNDPEFSPEYLSLMKEGIMVKNIRYQNGEGSINTEVISLEQVDVPASEFEPPAGYKKVSILEMLRSSSNMDVEQGDDEANDESDREN